MNLLEKEKKIWRDIWNVCIRHGGENWKEFREKNKGIHERMQMKSKNPIKKITTAQKHVNNLISFAQENNIIELVDRDNYQFKTLNSKDTKTVVQVLPELPNLKELTNQVIERNHKKIRIIDNWMSYLLLDESDLLMQWIKHCEELEILLLHPESPQIAHRFSTNKLDQLKEYRNNKKQALDCLEKLFQIIKFAKKEKGYRCNITIRLFDENPGLMGFIFDHKIYYGHFLSFSSSQSTFFHQLKRKDSHSEIDRQINKHFDKVWQSAIECNDQLVVQLINMYQFDDQDEYGYRKKMLETLEDNYVLYAPDDPENKISLKINKYQRAILKIDKSHATCQLIINHRESNEYIYYDGTVRAIGRANLLFRVRRKDFYISLLVFLGIEKKRKIYQGIYLHSNLNDRPISSYAILLPFSATDRSTQYPTREDEEIDGNIKRFFASKYLLRLNIESGIYDWNEYCDRKNIKNETLDHLCDSWALYYPYRYPQSIPQEKVIERSIDQAYYIAKAFFEIKKNKEEKYTCSFQSPPEEDVQLSGKPDIIEVSNQLYLSCTLQKGVEAGKTPVFLQLTFLLGKKQRRPELIDGTYNIVYANGAMGTGLVTMIKDNNANDCRLINPFDNPNIKNIPRSINYLVSEDISSLLLTETRKRESNQIAKYQGVYKVYVYVQTKLNGKKSIKTRGIAINRLEILKYGQVKFEGVRGIKATGRAFIQRDNNLYIDLKNVEMDKKRSGYFLLKVKENISHHTSIFCGIFAGLGVEDVQPLAKRVILELIPDSHNKFKVEKIPLHDLRLNNIPETVREALTGRIPNYIGFQRLQRGLFNEEDLKKYNDETPEVGKAFYQSAIYQSLKTNDINEIPEIISSIRRAILHGVDQLELFEREIIQSPIRDQICKHPEYKDLLRLINP